MPGVCPPWLSCCTGSASRTGSTRAARLEELTRARSIEGWAYPRRLLDQRVEALVVEAAAHRPEGFAEFPHVAGHDMVVEGLPVRPRFDERHVIGSIALRERVEAEIARILAAAFGQLLDDAGPLVLEGGNDVDVGQDIDSPPARDRFVRDDGQADVQALVIRGAQEPLQLLPEFLGVGGPRVSVLGRRPFPCLHDREVIRTFGSMERVEANAAFFLPARVAEGHEKPAGF